MFFFGSSLISDRFFSWARRRLLVLLIIFLPQICVEAGIHVHDFGDWDVDAFDVSFRIAGCDAQVSAITHVAHKSILNAGRLGGYTHLGSVGDFELSLLVLHSQNESLFKCIHFCTANYAAVLILLKVFAECGKIDLIVSMIFLGHNLVVLALLENKNTNAAPIFAETECFVWVVYALTDCWRAEQVEGSKQIDHLVELEILELVGLLDAHLIGYVPRWRLQFFFHEKLAALIWQCRHDLDLR